MIVNFVYVVRDRAAGRIKVGQTIDPRRRLGELDRGCGARVEVMELVACPSHVHSGRIERSLLSAAAKWRLEGEWVDAAAEDVLRERFDAIVRRPYDEFRAHEVYPLWVHEIRAMVE